MTIAITLAQAEAQLAFFMDLNIKSTMQSYSVSTGVARSVSNYSPGEILEQIKHWEGMVVRLKRSARPNARPGGFAHARMN